MPLAHTDGDIIIWFRKANVIHMGDCLFNRRYPVIDVSAGGSAEGMAAAADRVLAVMRPDTKLIPGHGGLATRKDLEAFRDMLRTSRARMSDLVKAGKSLDDIQKAKPLADLDAIWGKASITPDIHLKELYLDLTPWK